MQMNADYMKSGNCTKKTHLGERGVANILLSSNINGEFSICLEDEQNGIKSSWEMIMCEEDAKKVALRLAKITGIVSLDVSEITKEKLSTAYDQGYEDGKNNWLQEGRPQGDCENCDFRKFTEKFVDGFFEVMDKHGITSIEQLTEMLKGGVE